MLGSLMNCGCLWVTDMKPGWRKLCWLEKNTKNFDSRVSNVRICCVSSSHDHKLTLWGLDCWSDWTRHLKPPRTLGNCDGYFSVFSANDFQIFKDIKHQNVHRNFSNHIFTVPHWLQCLTKTCCVIKCDTETRWPDRWASGLFFVTIKIHHVWLSRPFTDRKLQFVLRVWYKLYMVI